MVGFGFRLVVRAVREFLDDGCAHLAASIAYRVLFSLFPLAIVVVGVFGLFFEDSRDDVVDAIVRNIPLSESGTEDIRSLLLRATTGLSALGLLGLVGLLWAASGMMGAIRTALNLAWDAEDRRPFVQGKALDLALVLAVSLVVGASFALTLIGELTPLGAAFGVVAPLVLAWLATLFLYRVVAPGRPPLREIALPALLVAGAFVALQRLFAFYVGNFGNYDAVYGSLGAVIAFLLFVYIASNVFLFGAELASEWPRLRDEPEPEDDEEGPPLSQQVTGALRGLVVRDRSGR